MSAITAALSAALIHFVWQGVLVGLLLWLTLAGLRNRSANDRYAAGLAALALLAALPVITAAVLYVRSFPTNEPAFPIAVSPRAMVDAEGPLTSTWSRALPPTGWLALLQFWALPVWALGVLLFSVRLVCGGVHVLVFGRRGEAADASVRDTVAGLAQRMGVSRPVRVLISTLTDGPGVIGWLRPIVLLPPATAMGLTPQQLEAVLAHEVAHIRRHDYLVNILQMMVETLLFYHPAVWWTSKRIRLERELCCDDLAVASCGDALAYARALTTLETLRVAKPSLVLGSTGGALLYRIQRLMSVSVHVHGPSRVPSVLAIGVGLACMALNVNWVRAQSQPSTRLEFEVASVKRNNSGPGDRGLGFQPGGRFFATNMPLRSLIATAYGTPQPLPLFRVVGGAGWLDSDGYNIEARAGDAFIPPQGGPGFSASGRLMLRTLLTDRFKLAVRQETREQPVYALVLASSGGRPGAQLRPSSGADCVAAPLPGEPPGPSDRSLPPCGVARFRGQGRVSAYSATMDQIATILEIVARRVVFNRTGLSGTYSFDLEFSPAALAAEATDRPLDSGISLFTALQEQLGLKLDSQRGPVNVLVIDRAERPTED